MEAIPGGITDEAGVSDDVTAFCRQVRQDVEGKIGRNVIMYIPVTCRSQVVAGIIYYVKVMIDIDGSCIFLNLFQPPGGAVGLLDVQDNKRADEPLEPF